MIFYHGGLKGGRGWQVTIDTLGVKRRDENKRNIAELKRLTICIDKSQGTAVKESFGFPI